ncbi:MAG: hypothetical protein Q7V56_04890 [Gammaproteobacteria bacterium]|nr:hypothetical protein [Gammaproteobacteria bacterium]
MSNIFTQPIYRNTLIRFWFLDWRNGCCTRDKTHKRELADQGSKIVPQRLIRHLAEPNTSPLRGSSSAVLAASQPVIRHLAEPNTSPCGQPAAVQNAARFVELGSSIFREAK